MVRGDRLPPLSRAPCRLCVVCVARCSPSPLSLLHSALAHPPRAGGGMDAKCVYLWREEWGGGGEAEEEGGGEGE